MSALTPTQQATLQNAIDEIELTIASVPALLNAAAARGLDTADLQYRYEVFRSDLDEMTLFDLPFESRMERADSMFARARELRRDAERAAGQQSTTKVVLLTGLVVVGVSVAAYGLYRYATAPKNRRRRTRRRRSRRRR